MTSPHTDAAREAAAKVFMQCLSRMAPPGSAKSFEELDGDDRALVNDTVGEIIDAFLAKSLEGADERVAESSRGISENERNLRNKIARGQMSASMFVTYLDLMGVDLRFVHGDWHLTRRTT